MRIINIFALFENPTGDPGWQLWNGDTLIGVYRTREQARIEARGRWTYANVRREQARCEAREREN